MAQPFSVTFSPAQVQELEQVRDHHPLAYVRVKAAGILKVRQGQSMRQVAKSGLLKSVRRETVKAWIVRYQHDGAASLWRGAWELAADGPAPGHRVATTAERTGRVQTAAPLAHRLQARTRKSAFARPGL